jgi:hypothetical protein
VYATVHFYKSQMEHVHISFRNFKMHCISALHTETTVAICLSVWANQALANYRKISRFLCVSWPFYITFRDTTETLSANRNIRFAICHNFNAQSVAVSACTASPTRINIGIAALIAIHSSPHVWSSGVRLPSH